MNTGDFYFFTAAKLLKFCPDNFKLSQHSKHHMVTNVIKNSATFIILLLLILKGGVSVLHFIALHWNVLNGIELNCNLLLAC